MLKRLFPQAEQLLVTAARARYAGRRLSGASPTLGRVKVSGLRHIVVVLALAALLGMLPSAIAAEPAPPALDPLAMPWLPEQGLAIQEARDVLLVGLDGHVYGRLAGFRLAPNSRGEMFGTLASYIPEATLLQGPLGRSWLLAGGRLSPVSASRFTLPGGALLDGRFVTTGYGSPEDPVAKIFVRDARSGTVLARGTDWGIVDGRLLVTAHAVVDLITRQQWTLPSGVRWGYLDATPDTCIPAGVHAGRVEAVCMISVKPATHRGFNGLIRFFAVSHGGRREPLGRPFLYTNLGALDAFLSPDGTQLAATLAVGCGPPYAIVGPTRGGVPLYVTGQRDVERSTAHVPNAEVLGWADGGRVVAEIGAGECEGGHPPGIYLVDPATFARTLIVTLARGDFGYTLWQSETASAVG